MHASRLLRPELRHAGLWFGLGLAYVGLIVWLSLTPVPPMPISLWDKAEHFAGYVALAAWFGAVCGASVHAWVVVAAVGLGAGLEVLQGWSGLRQFEFADMLANALGAVTGVLLARTSLGRVFVYIERTWNGRQARG